MAYPIGQSNWNSAGATTNAFIINPETERNMAYEYRQKSIVGMLSKDITNKTVGTGPEERDIDIGSSACVWTKEVLKGDEVRFTLEQKLAGNMTYGAAPVGTGDYLAYMHAQVYMNQQDTPAYPLLDDMSAIRVKDVIQDPDGQLRNAITLFLGEQHVLDFYSAFLAGASPNLMAATASGGRAVDLGLGAGVQVSPEDFLVAGSGFVSGTSGTSQYETNIETALAGLTNTAGDMFSRDFIHNLRYALPQKFKKPSMVGDKQKWYGICDPNLLATISAPGTSLDQAWQLAQQRSAENPTFEHGKLELNDIILIPDPWLAKFRPDISGGTIVWGQAGVDKRNFTSTSNIALMIIMGEGSMLEAHNGTVNLTEGPGIHGKGKSIAAHIKQSFMRTRYVPKDGRTGLVNNQSSLCCAFYDPGLSF